MAGDPGFTPIRSRQRGQDMDHGGLAGTIGPEEPHDLTAANFKNDVA